ncbi:hypothetical protein GGX14DRAFT_622567, partial [Mycena pura]
ARVRYPLQAARARVARSRCPHARCPRSAIRPSLPMSPGATHCPSHSRTLPKTHLPSSAAYRMLLAARRTSSTSACRRLRCSSRRDKSLHKPAHARHHAPFAGDECRCAAKSVRAMFMEHLSGKSLREAFWDEDEAPLLADAYPRVPADPRRRWSVWSVYGNKLQAGWDKHRQVGEGVLDWHSAVEWKCALTSRRQDTAGRAEVVHEKAKKAPSPGLAYTIMHLAGTQCASCRLVRLL